MPKKVDHHARRTQIADALLRIAATHGLQAISLRHVAAEAGVSAGMVQHYFRTKDKMMTFALEVVSDNVQARLAAGAADLDDADSPKAVVRALLVQMLPLDEARRLEGHVGLAFHAYAAIRPAMADQLRADAELLLAFLADRIRAAQRSGDAPATLDPAGAAITLLALVEGLSMQVLVRYYPPETALDIFDAHLCTVFDPPPDDRARGTVG
ncbi:MAG: TetR/AcrR family transcriptional regulator [Pseudonocardiaceae bacterium]